MAIKVSTQHYSTIEVKEIRYQESAMELFSRVLECLEDVDGVDVAGMWIEMLVSDAIYHRLCTVLNGHTNFSKTPSAVERSMPLFTFVFAGTFFHVAGYTGAFGPIILPGLPITVKYLGS